MNAQKLFVTKTDCFVDTSLLPFLGKSEQDSSKLRQINPWSFLVLLLFFASLLSIQRLYLYSQNKKSFFYLIIQNSEDFFFDQNRKPFQL